MSVSYALVLTPEAHETLLELLTPEEFVRMMTVYVPNVPITYESYVIVAEADAEALDLVERTLERAARTLAQDAIADGQTDEESRARKYAAEKARRTFARIEVAVQKARRMALAERLSPSAPPPSGAMR